MIEEKLKKRSEKIWETDLQESEQNALYEYSGAHYGVTNRYVRNSLLQEKTPGPVVVGAGLIELRPA